MRIARLATAVALVTAAFAAPAHAHTSGTGSLVVDATRTAYVDVRFTTSWIPTSFGITGSGTYAYVGIRRHGADFQALQWTHFGAWQRDGGPDGRGQVTTDRNMHPPGRYRVYVVTDGPARAVVRFHGRGSMRVRASVPFAATASYRRLSPVDAVTGTYRETYTHGSRTTEVFALRAKGLAPARAHLDARICLTPAGRSCDDQNAFRANSASFSAVPMRDDAGPWSEWLVAMTPSPRMLPVGRTDALWETAPYGDAAVVDVFRLTASLP